MSTGTTKALGSEAVTKGIRVRVEPSYVDAHSDPERGRFIFAYKVRITNESDSSITLTTRHWTVVDANGISHEVDGPGVVGQHPTIAPDESFEYSSYCPLPTPWGTMEGHFDFQCADESSVTAQVARFYLARS